MQNSRLAQMDRQIVDLDFDDVTKSPTQIVIETKITILNDCRIAAGDFINFSEIA